MGNRIQIHEKTNNFLVRKVAVKSHLDELETGKRKTKPKSKLVALQEKLNQTSPKKCDDKKDEKKKKKENSRVEPKCSKQQEKKIEKSSKMVSKVAAKNVVDSVKLEKSAKKDTTGNVSKTGKKASCFVGTKLSKVENKLNEDTHRLPPVKTPPVIDMSSGQNKIEKCTLPPFKLKMQPKLENCANLTEKNYSKSDKKKSEKSSVNEKLEKSNEDKSAKLIEEKSKKSKICGKNSKEKKSKKSKKEKSEQKSNKEKSTNLSEKSAKKSEKKTTEEKSKKFLEEKSKKSKISEKSEKISDKEKASKELEKSCEKSKKEKSKKSDKEKSEKEISKKSQKSEKKCLDEKANKSEKNKARQSVDEKLSSVIDKMQPKTEKKEKSKKGELKEENVLKSSNVGEKKDGVTLVEKKMTTTKSSDENKVSAKFLVPLIKEKGKDQITMQMREEKTLTNEVTVGTAKMANFNKMSSYSKGSQLSSCGSVYKSMLLNSLILKNNNIKADMSQQIKEELIAKKEIDEIPFVIGEVKRPKMSCSKLKTEFLHRDLDEHSSTILEKSINEDSGKSETNYKLENDAELNPIFKEEFEHFYDKLKELNHAVVVLKQSYRNIISSLVKLHRDRSTDANDNEKVNFTKDEKAIQCSMLTTKSEMKQLGKMVEQNVKKRTSDSCHYLTTKSDDSLMSIVIDSKFAIERFTHPMTRDETFNELFVEVQKLNDSLSRLKNFFDSDGSFIYQEYEHSDYRISRSVFDNVSSKTQMYLTIVHQITNVYNQDFLDMFRIC